MRPMRVCKRDEVLYEIVKGFATCVNEDER